jgi:hypothetical protein
MEPRVEQQTSGSCLWVSARQITNRPIYVGAGSNTRDDPGDSGKKQQGAAAAKKFVQAGD